MVNVIAVVNVIAFEGVNPSRLRRASTTFDGEGDAVRLARRQRNWIATVRQVCGREPDRR